MKNRYFSFENHINIFIFVLITSLTCLFSTSFPEDNVNTRLDLTAALVNHKNTIIDEYHSNTIDKAFYNNHFYSDKAPGLSLTAVPVAFFYSLFKTPDPNNIFFRYICTFFCVGLPASFFSVFFFYFLRRIDFEPFHSFFIVFSLYASTIFLLYSGLFLSHVPTAIIIFYLLFKIHDIDNINVLGTFIFGFLASLLPIFEYPLLVHSLLLIFCFSLFVKNKRFILYLLIGMLVPFILFLTYNSYFYHNPFFIGYSFESNDYFFENMKHGLFGLSTPKITSFYDIIFKPSKGLFFQSPFLIFSPYFLIKSLSSSSSVKRISLISLLLISSSLIINSSQFLPLGGMTAGPRHLVPILPILVLFSGFSLKSKNIAFKYLYITFIFLSLCRLFLINITFPQPPEHIYEPLFVSYIFIKEHLIRPLFFENIYFSNYYLLGLSTLFFLTFIPFFIYIIIIFKKALLFFIIALFTIFFTFYHFEETFHKYYDSKTYYEIGQYFYRSKLYDKSLLFYDKSLSLDKSNSLSLFGKGMIQAKSNHPESSILSFEKAYFYNNKLLESQYNLGLLLLNSNSYESLKHFLIFIKNNRNIHDPKYINALKYITILYYRNNDFCNAYKYYNLYDSSNDPYISSLFQDMNMIRGECEK